MSNLGGAQNIVSLKNVDQSFVVGEETIDVLHDINFELQANTFNIIYGPSGSGKSTLLNILSGLQHPTKGTVVFGGSKLYELSPNDLAAFRANQIGIVYQQNYWVKSLTALENVSLPMYFLGYSKSSAAKIAQNALEQVGMGSYGKKEPGMLSGGEQQRIAMARAIVNNPLFIIADEPTGSLDSKNGDMIMNLLQECQTVLKRTIILVTHNMEYLPLADKLLHIQDGHVTEQQDESINKTATELLDQMKERIDRLSKAKVHGVQKNAKKPVQ